ncbi:MAG: metal ABC transporter ATP-binding protein [Bauldia sp.]|nr:metal ABC transporter ATP-binding protein [Bauldia sp.]
MTLPSPSAAEPLAAVENLGVRLGGRWIVRHVDLAVRPGEIVTVIGPNGGGKTTTAKALLGLISPAEGRSVHRPGLRVGYVPQKLAIDWTLPMTVGRLMQLTGRHPRAAIDAALGEVGIPHLAGTPIQALSGGEFQRALLARAIVRRPELLVLDEPVQGVDFAGELALYELIGTIRDRLGCGVLLISHDLHIVMARTDTVVCLEGGVSCRGAPHAVTESPQYQRLFGPRAAAALAVYAHEHHHDHGQDHHGHDHGHDHDAEHHHG